MRLPASPCVDTNLSHTLSIRQSAGALTTGRTQQQRSNLENDMSTARVACYFHTHTPAGPLACVSLGVGVGALPLHLPLSFTPRHARITKQGTMVCNRTHRLASHSAFICRRRCSLKRDISSAHTHHRTITADTTPMPTPQSNRTQHMW